MFTMKIEQLLDNFCEALLAIEPHLRKLDIDLREHDWSEGIVGSLFNSLVDEPTKEETGRGVFVLELCDYKCPPEAYYISFKIRSGSVYHYSETTKDTNHFTWVDRVADKDIQVAVLTDFSNPISDDPNSQLNYALGCSLSGRKQYFALTEHCEFSLSDYPCLEN